MLSLQLDVQPATEQRLRRLMSQVADQETFARNVIAFQVYELKHFIRSLVFCGCEDSRHKLA